MKVTLYTITDCKFSQLEKDYFRLNNIQFEEKNLETNKDFLPEMLSISNNFQGTPVTRIIKDNGQTVIMKGFSKEDFDKELSLNVVPTTTNYQQEEKIIPPAQQQQGFGGFGQAPVPNQAQAQQQVQNQQAKPQTQQQQSNAFGGQTGGFDSNNPLFLHNNKALVDLDRLQFQPKHNNKYKINNLNLKHSNNNQILLVIKQVVSDSNNPLFLHSNKVLVDLDRLQLQPKLKHNNLVLLVVQ